MAWTAPRTYTAGEIITASILNSAVRDNLRYLKGLDGVPTIESGLTIDNTDGDERLLLPLLSTAECNTALNAEGEVAFDEQTHQMKEYDGTAVRAIISEADVDDTPVDSATTVPISSNWAYDHVAAADPHTGYVLESLLTTQGDIAYATADSTWQRLAKGTEGQILRQGATIPGWASAVATQEIFSPALPTAGDEANVELSGVAVDQAGDACFMRVLVPQDFSSITAIEVIFICNETGASMHFNVYTQYGSYSGGEAFNVHTETANARDIGSTTTNEYLNHSISDLVDVAALTAGDVLVVQVSYNATAIDSNALISGLRLKYT